MCVSLCTGKAPVSPPAELQVQLLVLSEPPRVSEVRLHPPPSSSSHAVTAFPGKAQGSPQHSQPTPCSLGPWPLTANTTHVHVHLHRPHTPGSCRTCASREAGTTSAPAPGDRSPGRGRGCPWAPGQEGGPSLRLCWAGREHTQQPVRLAAQASPASIPTRSQPPSRQPRRLHPPCGQTAPSPSSLPSHTWPLRKACPLHLYTHPSPLPLPVPGPASKSLAWISGQLPAGSLLPPVAPAPPHSSSHSNPGSPSQDQLSLRPWLKTLLQPRPTGLSCKSDYDPQPCSSASGPPSTPHPLSLVTCLLTPLSLPGTRPPPAPWLPRLLGGSLPGLLRLCLDSSSQGGDLEHPVKTSSCPPGSRPAARLCPRTPHSGAHEHASLRLLFAFLHLPAGKLHKGRRLCFGHRHNPGI